jgi:hypothetical protein
MFLTAVNKGPGVPLQFAEGGGVEVSSLSFLLHDMNTILNTTTIDVQDLTNFFMGSLLNNL